MADTSSPTARTSGGVALPGAASLRRSLRTGFLVQIALLVSLSAVGFFTVSGMAETSRLLADRHEIHARVAELLSFTKDLQASEQAFVLTGQETWLEPYKTALAEVERAVHKVEELSDSHGLMVQRIGQLRPLVAELRAALRELVETRRERGLEAVLPLVKGGRSEQAMTSLRKLEQEIAEDEREALRERRDATDSRARGSLGGIGVTGLVAILFGLFVHRRTVHAIDEPVQQAIHQLSVASAQILASTTLQASNVQQQAAMVTQTVATVDEVVRTSDQSMQRARAVSELSQRSLECGKAGRKAVEEAIGGMGSVKEHVDTISQAIMGFAEQSQAIGEITGTVKDLAEQTNLLAINAAIEASRAGEVGKGFGVVAAEVKALADQSKKATAQVRQILVRIRRANSSAVASISDGMKSVADTIHKINQAGEMIGSLTEMISSSAQASSQISVAAAQQTTGMGQIHQAMQQLQDVARQNAVSMTQLDELARDLNEVGARLEKLVGA